MMANDMKAFTNLADDVFVAARLHQRHILCSAKHGAAKITNVFAFIDDNEELAPLELP
jgi:hypothetical protein